MEKIYAAAEAAKLWGLGASTVRQAIHEGRLVEGQDVRKSGGIWLVKESAMKRLYGEVKAVTVNEDTLREWLEKLFYRAGEWQGTGGECHLYANIIDGELQNFHFVDFAGHNSWCDGDDLICIATMSWFDPLHHEDYSEWWKNEEESEAYPDWEDYASKFPEEWEQKLAEWREVWLDVNVNDWMQEEIDSLEEHLEQIGKPLILV